VTTVLESILDLAGAFLLVLGAFFCLAAAIAQVRFPDVMARIHAVTKPQVFGLLLAITGIALTLRTWSVVSILLVVGLFQLVTAPVAAHMVARTAYRTGQWASDEALVDELGEDLAESGFTVDPDRSPQGRPSRDGHDER